MAVLSRHAARQRLTAVSVIKRTPRTLLCRAADIALEGEATARPLRGWNLDAAREVERAAFGGADARAAKRCDVHAQRAAMRRHELGGEAGRGQHVAAV